jgi:prolyl oligopeptidase
VTGPPKAEVKTVIDDYAGHKISDPYRWLEDGQLPETVHFVEAQNTYSQKVLESVPGRDTLRTRIRQLLGRTRIGGALQEGKYYFFARREGSQNQPVVYVRDSLDGPDRALIDVNGQSSDGTIGLDWWYPSHDGKYMAYGTSPDGSEISTLHVIETATGKLLPEKIWRTRSISLAWLPDNSGFYYTRYPSPGDVPTGQELYNRRVFFHKLGSEGNADGLQDPLVFGEEIGPADWPDVQVSNDGKWLMVSVSKGWTKDELYLKDLTAPANVFVRITTDRDFHYSSQIVDGRIYVTTNEDAPRGRIFKVAANDPERGKWREIVPESSAVIDGRAQVIGGRLFVRFLRNACSALSIFDLEGRRLQDVPMPTLGTIGSLGGEWNGSQAFFSFQSYGMPVTLFRVSLDGKVNEFLRIKTDFDPAKYEVKQLWVTSKDGTRVSMFVIHKKGLQLNGKIPTVLYGYGGFNFALTPSFDRGGVLAFLERGGIYGEAQLRGGNEFGDDWHRAGMLDKKQNVFDDFIAAAENLIAQKYTDKDHLAVLGGSNGGLLIGAVVTQRPDLFRAAVCMVPLLDMLRYQRFQIAELWVPEYGSSDNPTQFDFLFAYSPYHHVKTGIIYPSIFFLRADGDTRVDSMHAKKMTALLQAQAANGPDRPILLRVDTKAGHGMGKPLGKVLEDQVDMWSFLFWQLDVK